MTELKVRRAGMLTSVQDLGRWGFQSSGVPVAGAMDLPALRLGNAMLGNPEGAAALEVTLLGPELEVCGGCAAVCPRHCHRFGAAGHGRQVRHGLRGFQRTVHGKTVCLRISQQPLLRWFPQSRLFVSPACPEAP